MAFKTKEARDAAYARWKERNPEKFKEHNEKAKLRKRMKSQELTRAKKRNKLLDIIRNAQQKLAELDSISITDETIDIDSFVETMPDI